MSSIEPIHSGLKLHVLEGERHQDFYWLEKALISIGRSTPETVNAPGYITFPEPTVSRLHAVLTWEEGAKAYLLHHRSQTNPTIVNNLVINSPQLLKPGDRITLGRLILLVEQNEDTASTGETNSLEPAKLSLPKANLNAFVLGSQHKYSTPIEEDLVLLHFQNDKTAATNEQESAKCQAIHLQAKALSTLRLKREPGTLTFDLEIEPYSQTKAFRITQGGNGCKLLVPLRTGYTTLIQPTDAVLHQNYILWIGDPDSPPYQEPAVLDSASDPGASASERLVSLNFLNGPWKGATVSTSSQVIAGFRLGPGDLGFGHVGPIKDSASCEIVIDKGIAHLRVTEITDEQLVEVDGRSIFLGESVRLVGGSRIDLDNWGFSWDDGQANLYLPYSLKEQESARIHPITKATVRLGTAAHCEIIISNSKLPPVIGYITFEKSGPTYHHQDLSCGVVINGHQIESGLSQALEPGSTIRLRPELTICLEKSE